MRSNPSIHPLNAPLNKRGCLKRSRRTIRKIKSGSFFFTMRQKEPRLIMSPCREPLPQTTSSTDCSRFPCLSFPRSSAAGRAQAAVHRTADVSACNDINNGFLLFFLPFLPPPSPPLLLLVSKRFVLLTALRLCRKAAEERSHLSLRPSGGSCVKKCKMSTGAESEERAR